MASMPQVGDSRNINSTNVHIPNLRIGRKDNVFVRVAKIEVNNEIARAGA